MPQERMGQGGPIEANEGHSARANTMWGGRFETTPSAIMEEINASIDFDQRLFRQDIEASRVHCRMLEAQGLLTTDDADAICAGLAEILAEIEAGTFIFSRALEDIHMNVENRLKEKIGECAGRLHTARSRNDQVATDFKLYVRTQCETLEEGLRALQRALALRAQQEASTPMPGFTHLQTAQPITFGHYLLAYVEMFERDRGRLYDARNRLNECPLGACALAGTSFPIDRDRTARELGFRAPMANSLDAVSDRDFALETLAACAICATHLSRLAEELVLFCTSPFSFIRLSDRWTTGSSIMPQKRNPDAAELVRAKSGRIMGALVSLFVVMKGLPLAYSKDMQEDKEATFQAFDALLLCLRAMAGMVEDLEPNRSAMEKAAGEGFSTATDLADWLVLRLNIPFRQAHHITGRIVALSERLGCPLDHLPLKEMQAIEPAITADVFSVLSVPASVASRHSFGGTAPERVQEQAHLWHQRLTPLTKG